MCAAGAEAHGAGVRVRVVVSGGAEELLVAGRARGARTADAMQRLLTSAVWDADAVRDDLRTLMVTRLAHPDGVLIVDETGHVKKGVCAVGVQRQYTGTAGRIENSQVAVYLGYASPHGRALIDRRLYLPREGWCDDPQRPAAAGVPTSVQFATKPPRATERILAWMQAGAAARWVTAEEVYGGNPQFRAALRGRRIGYVLAVGCHTRVELPASRRRVAAAVAQLPVAAWQRRSAGAGSKGPRHYDWAWMQLAASADDTSLLVRRNRSTGELAYYLCWSPDPQPLAALVAVAGRR